MESELLRDVIYAWIVGVCGLLGGLAGYFGFSVVYERLLKGVRYREVDISDMEGMDGSGDFAGDLRHAGDRK